MPANDFIAAAYRQAAAHISGRPVDVRWLDDMPGKSGVAFKAVNGTPTIYLHRGMEPVEELFVFCHELAHVVLGHTDKMAPTPRRDMETFCKTWQEPVTIGDHIRQAYAEVYREPAADTLAVQWLKYADYHASAPGILPRLLALMSL